MILNPSLGGGSATKTYSIAFAASVTPTSFLCAYAKPDGTPVTVSTRTPISTQGPFYVSFNVSGSTLVVSPQVNVTGGTSVQIERGKFLISPEADSVTVTLTTGSGSAGGVETA